MTFQQEVAVTASYNVGGFYITAFTNGNYSLDYVGDLDLEREFYSGGFHELTFETVDQVYEWLLDCDLLNGEEEIYVLDEEMIN